MRNIGQVLFVILIVVLIFAIAYNWTKKQLSTLAQRLIIVEQEIAIALENLRLTEKLKMLLDRRVKLIFFGLKLTCFVLLGVLWLLLFQGSGTLLNSIFDAFDVVGLGYVLVSLLVFNKLADTNLLISLIRKQIQVWVYRRAGFDPIQISQIQNIIAQKTDEVNKLRNQLERIEQL